MAANKFATMLHRNTNKIIVALVYAVLEWLLISLLLLNSLFGYLITKYAEFFGLKHPCIWCSRVNNGGLLHNANSIEGSVCNDHAAEISKLSYCIHHGKLAESQDLCEDCSMQKWQHEEEETEIVSRCKCCNGGLNSTSYLLFKPSWCTLDYTKQGDIVIEELDGGEDGEEEEEEEEKKTKDEHQVISDVDSFSFREASEEEGNNNDIVLQSSITSKCFVEDDSVQVMDLQFMRHGADFESLRVVPVDLIDSSMIESLKFRILTMEIASVVEAPQDEAIKQLETNGELDQKQEEDPDVLDDAADKLENSKAATEQEAEEDRFPDTPTSLDSLHKKRESSSMEESLDGSMDGGDGVLTVDRLKSALTKERKALRALYSELEEERSASAIATNHTMAMITRLQEEKAAMQMEALQYQRMMEEQAEYDQEALQLLNELMVKREKEREELERELEIYRDQVVVDDCSDDDGGALLTVDLNRAMIENSPEDEDEDQELEEMALDCMKHMGELDDSLAEFEEERVSILDQLKALEEKLLLMSSADQGEGQVGDDDIEADIEEEQRETMESMAKRLLPLLDEAEDESAEVEMEMEINSVMNQERMDDEELKKLDVVEEVDRVFERLQALKDDQEFLKNCMESVKNHSNGGDEQEEMNPLQEIFQHLRDLKRVELRVQSLGNV